MKLPLQMRAIVLQTLKMAEPEKAYLFKTVFIRGLVDESGAEAFGAMKSRFVHLYSESSMKITEALFFVKKLLGDAFTYSISDDFSLPEESSEVDIMLHERSRILNADDFCNIFNKSTPEESIQCLLKSTVLLTVNTFKLNGCPDAYTCDLNIRPTVAVVTPKDQKRISFANPYTAIEATVKFDEYEDMVDKYFDCVVIAYNDKVTELIAPETTMELLNVAKKIVLGETYKDEFTNME